MKAFIDTSSLMKKYIEEEGSDKFEKLLTQISEIVISPISLIELMSSIDRRLSEKSITKNQMKWLEKELIRDVNYFSKVIWNDELEYQSIKSIEKHSLRTLDSIQLASAILSKSDTFITSDKKLYLAAKKELNNTKFI